MIGATKAGRPFVGCDHCNKRLYGADRQRANARSIVAIQRGARDHGWTFDPKKGRPQKAKCPACNAGICEECGAPRIGVYRTPHEATAHHKAMVACTRQAVEGFAPVPKLMHAALADSLRDPVFVHYADDDGWSALRFVRIEHLDELAEIEHDAVARLVARVARIAARSTWWTAWRDEIGPALRQIDDGRRVVWRNGFPWPSLGDVVSAAQEESAA